MSQRKNEQIQGKKLLQPISGYYISKYRLSFDNRLFSVHNLMKNDESLRLLSNNNYQSNYKYGGKVKKGFEVSIYDERIKYIINNKDQIVLNKNLQRILSIQSPRIKRKSKKASNSKENKSNVQKNRLKRTSSTLLPSIRMNKQAQKTIVSLDCQGKKCSFILKE